ncbi:Uma2 family endonuclease [Thiocapsa sp. UBA6158]|jgi:hypothetical protein|uniref:Uma2 family endonuclease n=1 Tax=Thiocapsa sp. UBA6158 TaxID=1947692 RepID=UPI0025EDB3CF|nr:Uma2 family endonuclease [Thiocapsa sp. UBA6158]
MTRKLAGFNLPGPFRADQLKPGDPYELSGGHPVECLPVGGRGSRANLIGATILDSDPDVESAGVDTGFALTPDTLRAPDVAVGNVTDAPGWVKGAAPPLAVEYADTGQDEVELTAKIADLLAAGTRLVWVVRLVGPHRVEIHAPESAMRLAYPGEVLAAPGILRNPVPVAALFDRNAAHEVTLRNLLQRKGYRDLEQVREDGKAEGLGEGELAALRDALTLILDQRALSIKPERHAEIRECVDPNQLRRWLRLAIGATSESDIFGASANGA